MKLNDFGILCLMARPPKGKPLTLRPIRLDDDVWAECQRLGKENGTINEGLRKKILPFGGDDIPITREEVPDRALEANEKAKSRGWRGLDDKTAKAFESARSWKRGPRQKGDKTR